MIFFWGKVDIFVVFVGFSGLGGHEVGRLGVDGGNGDVFSSADKPAFGEADVDE